MVFYYTEVECNITALLDINDVLYAGTRAGAIVAINVAKMIIHAVMCVQNTPIHSLAFIRQFGEVKKVTTLKRRKTSVIINHSLHHDPQDDCLLISFALGYHGITHKSDSRPLTYNLPTMLSHSSRHQPTPTHNPDDLYMLLWSAHPW